MEGRAGTRGLGGPLDGGLAELLLGEGRGVRVESEHDLLVLERVLLLHAGALGLGVALGRVEHGLDFSRVDQARDVGVGHDVGRDGEVLLGGVHVVEGAKGRRGPHDEATEVAAGRELEEVEREDGGGLDTGDVAEGLDEVLAVDLGVVDDEGTAALAVAAVTQLTLTGANLAGLLDLDELRAGAEGLEEGDGGLGLDDGVTLECLGVDDERHLSDLTDTVATGEEESRDGGSSQGRGSSEAPVRVSILLFWYCGTGYHTSGQG